MGVRTGAWRGLRVGWVALVGLAALTACTFPTQQAYRETVTTWVGRPLDQLALTWGVPDRSIDLSDGSRLIEYDRQTVRYVPGMRYMDQVPVMVRDAQGRRRVTYATVWREGPSSTVFERCLTRFRIGRDSRVEEVAFEGPSCVAYPRTGPAPAATQPSEPSPQEAPAPTAAPR